MNANNHPIKVQEVSGSEIFANDHPYKVEVIGGGGGGGDATWGTIKGNIDSQVDLKNKLDAKSANIILNYDGENLLHNGQAVSFQDVKNLINEDKNTVLIKTNTGLYLSNTISVGDMILLFTATYENAGSPYLAELSIDSTDSVAYREMEISGGSDVKLYNTVFGNNTDGAPTQNAILNDIFGNDTSKQKVNLPVLKVNSGVGNYAYTLGIGSNTTIGGAWAIALGNRASTGGTGTVALGHFANAAKDGSVSLGAYSSAASKGEVNIGSSNVSYGYNNTNYRLITGVHNPVNDHDAATKNYVDAQVGKVMHVCTVNTDTAVGTWNYTFSFLSSNATPMTKLIDVAGYLYTVHRGATLPVSGTYTENGDIYIITKLTQTTASTGAPEMQIEMRKMSDGSLRVISSSQVELTDMVM